MPGLIGKKIGMTSVFGADGKNIPCTVIEAGPCVVTQIRTEEVDGYAAVQLAYADIIDAAKAKANDRSLFWKDCGADFVEPVEKVSSAFMLRLKGSVDDYKSVVSDTSSILLGDNSEFTVITATMTEKEIADIETKLANLNISVLSKIRVLDF